MNFNWPRLRLHYLLAEMRHHFFRHEFLVLQNQIIRYLAHMSTADQHTCMEHISIVSELLNHSSRASRNHNTCINQFFEASPLPYVRTTCKRSSQTAFAHIAWGNEKLRANFERFMEDRK